jgi:hypothetical protein
MVLTVSFVLSPVNGLIATVPAQCKALPRVDASTAASGPHDFPVRLMARSSGAPQTSIASRAQRVVTIAKRPSIGRETAAALKVICPTAKAENFCGQGWTFQSDHASRTDLPVGQIHINKQRPVQDQPLLLLRQRIQTSAAGGRGQSFVTETVRLGRIGIEWRG